MARATRDIAEERLIDPTFRPMAYSVKDTIARAATAALASLANREVVPIAIPVPNKAKQTAVLNFMDTMPGAIRLSCSTFRNHPTITQTPTSATRRPATTDVVLRGSSWTVTPAPDAFVSLTASLVASSRVGAVRSPAV